MKYFLSGLIAVCAFFSMMWGVFANATETPTTVQEKKEIQKSINDYILEIYKFQGNKILQDLDTNLDKVAPTKETKLEAYKNIQETLKLKKEAIETDKKTGKNTKIILIQYLDFLINELEEKKKKL